MLVVLDDSYTRLGGLLAYIARVFIIVLTDFMLVTGSLLNFIFYVTFIYYGVKAYNVVQALT